MALTFEKEKIKQLVSCPICDEDYDRHIHLPKYLPCRQHTVCIVCLKKLIQHSPDDKTVKCPFCNHKHVLPPNDTELNEYCSTNIEALYLKDLLQDQLKPNRSRLDSPTCDNCCLKNIGYGWCEECSKVLCKECCHMHDSFEIEGHPQSTSIQYIDLKEVRRKRSCTKHKRHSIALVCYDHEQVEYLCDMCAEDDRHTGHNLTDLITEMEKTKQEVDELCNQALKKYKQDSNRKGQLKKAVVTLNENLEVVKSQISKCQETSMRLLQEYGKHKECEFHTMEEEKTSKLRKDVEVTEQLCKTFENIQTAIEQFHLASPVSMIEESRKIISDLKEYLAFENEKATVNVFMEVDNADFDNNFQTLLKTANEIRTSPSRFQISHPTVAFKDHQFEVHIQSISNSNVCLIGGLQVRARVDFPCCDDHKEAHVFNLDDNKNGKYALKFTPKSTGLYKFHIYIEGFEAPTADLEVSVHRLDMVFQKIVFCDEIFELRAIFRNKMELDEIKNIDVVCKDEVCNSIQPTLKLIDTDNLVATFLPNKLGKVGVCITCNGMRIAGPFKTSVCKRITWDTNNITEDEITDVATNKDGVIYLADTQINKRIISINQKKAAIVNSYQNEGTSFIAFDKEGKLFVLFITNGNNTAEKTKTELHIPTPEGQRSFILKSLANPGGFAVSPSGSVVSVSDQEKHCVFFYQTPDATDKNTIISPIKSIGERGNHWGQFVNPTSICIQGNDRLFVCDKGNGRVQELDHIHNNTINVYGPEVRRLQHPEAICLSPEGYLLILDREKIVAIRVGSCIQKTLFEIEISCRDRLCNFNHLICCLPDCQIVHVCCGYNHIRVFQYEPLVHR